MQSTLVKKSTSFEMPTRFTATFGSSPPTDMDSEQTPPTQPSDCWVVSFDEQLPSGGENFGDTSQVAQLDSATAVSVDPVSRSIVKD